MKKIIAQISTGFAILLFCSPPIAAAELRTLPTVVPEVAANLPKVGPLPAANRLHVAVSLPFHNQDKLNTLYHDLYAPGSPRYHRYLTPEEFTKAFGPTEEEYEKVKNFAQSVGLKIVGTYSNRAVLDMAGPVSDVENAFHVHINQYQHPTQNRIFYGPDVKPVVDASLPISGVTGMDDYYQKPRHVKREKKPGPPPSSALNGSGEDGYYLGNDFRNAYVPGVSLKGEGQVVGLVELLGYTTSDIRKYESLGGLAQVPLLSVVIDNAYPLPDQYVNSDVEIALDIEMVAAMAPGLTDILIVDGTNGVDTFNYFASPPKGITRPNQISSSWGTSGQPDCVPQLMELAVQGQSVFFASGDDGAPANGKVAVAEDFNYLTLVGGTELSMNGNGGSWSNETVWDYQFIQGASTGLVDTADPIPYYQNGINTTANGGSSIYRNDPDVAMCADGIEIVYSYETNGIIFSNNITVVGGTSAAAPLWAAFTALVNQQAASEGLPPVGFINPALYRIAQGPSYTSCFHDITVGNNTSPDSDNLYYAGPGYDNCTGLGTPNGINLINALVATAGTVYVNFGYTGTQTGAYLTPFNTLAGGINAVASGGTIVIETAGSSSETMTITKPMTIVAQDGAATVGN
jgi:subtilase family serine protease